MPKEGVIAVRTINGVSGNKLFNAFVSPMAFYTSDDSKTAFKRKTDRDKFKYHIVNLTLIGKLFKKNTCCGLV